MQVSSIFKIDSPLATQGVTTCFVKLRYITQDCRYSALDRFARRNKMMAKPLTKLFHLYFIAWMFPSYLTTLKSLHKGWGKETKTGLPWRYGVEESPWGLGMPTWSPRLVLSVQVSPFVISSAEPFGSLREKKHSKYRYFYFQGKAHRYGWVWS